MLLRDHVNARVGFETRAAELDKNPKSHLRMQSSGVKPRPDNLLGMVGYLKKREGVAVTVELTMHGQA